MFANPWKTEKIVMKYILPEKTRLNLEKKVWEEKGDRIDY